MHGPEDSILVLQPAKNRRTTRFNGPIEKSSKDTKGNDQTIGDGFGKPGPEFTEIGRLRPSNSP